MTRYGGRRLVATACAAALLCAGSLGAQSAPPWLNPYRRDAARLIRAAQADDFAYRRLAEMTDSFGARLSGTDNLRRAIAWAAETMKADGLDNVRTEPVMVPHWVRGRESGEMLANCHTPNRVHRARTAQISAASPSSDGLIWIRGSSRFVPRNAFPD